MKTLCNVQGCRDEMHARGYCNRHYKKYMRVGDPTAGRVHNYGTRDNTKSKTRVYMDPQPERREKVKPNAQETFSFLLNQKFIERLYKEVIKAQSDPLIKAHNEQSIFTMLRLCVELAGYHDNNTEFLADLLAELEEWATRRDSLRFMNCLATWPARHADFFKPRAVKQLALEIK